MQIIYLDHTDSTNEYIKRFLQKGENVIVCAKMQTGGKGTKGRSFLSEGGGVYLSALVFHKNLSAREAFRIMAHAAVAVCRTAEKFGAAPEIKWANDVLISNKKLAGILIENAVSNGFLHHSIMGIGMNVLNDVSSLGGIAVSLAEAAQKNCTAQEVRDALIRNFLTPSSFEEYLGYAKFLGNEVQVTEGEEVYAATAKEILPDGRLKVQTASGERVLSSAEVRVRLR
ncbi:MAG: biotin--[Clostridia bacterium]|nr:biotin--[acetyl-CoA-carboxylase] ligase [Clostridia bacterium]